VVVAPFPLLQRACGGEQEEAGVVKILLPLQASNNRFFASAAIASGVRMPELPSFSPEFRPPDEAWDRFFSSPPLPKTL